MLMTLLFVDQIRTENISCVMMITSSELYVEDW